MSVLQVKSFSIIFLIPSDLGANPSPRYPECPGVSLNYPEQNPRFIRLETIQLSRCCLWSAAKHLIREQQRWRSERIASVFPLIWLWLLWEQLSLCSSIRTETLLWRFRNKTFGALLWLSRRLEGKHLKPGFHFSCKWIKMCFMKLSSVPPEETTPESSRVEGESSG